MHKGGEKKPLGSWVKPSVRRIVGGSAEFAGIHNVDGSGTLS